MSAELPPSILVFGTDSATSTLSQIMDGSV
jgi:hypothetical protein